MGSCLGGLLGAEQVFFFFWRDGGQVSAATGVSPPAKKASLASGPRRHGTALPKARALALSCRDPAQHLLELTRTEGSCLAAEGRGGVPCRAMPCHAMPCPLQGLCPPGPQPTPSGATAGWKGYGGAQSPSFCSQFAEKLLPAGNVKAPSESLSLHVLDTGL